MKRINIKKRTNFDYLKTLSDLIKQDYRIEDAYKLLYSIYHDEIFLFSIEQLKSGTGIENTIILLTDHRLFKELFLFYSQTSPIDEAIINSLELCEQINDFKHRMKSILTYPCFLLICVFVFSIISITYLQPQFMLFYESFNIELSFLHSLALNVLFYLPGVLIAFICLVAAITLRVVTLLKSNTFEKYDFFLQVPVVRSAIKTYLTVKFCVFYKEFLKLDQDLKTILEFMLEKIEDPTLRMIAYEMQRQLLEGKHPQAVIEESPFFDSYFKTVFQLSLSLDHKEAIFQHYYDHTFSRISTMIDLFKNIITPATYLFIGTYIVGLYALMIMPMTNMISSM